jgi:hypothetical protein
MTRIGTDNAVKLFQLNKKTAVVIAGRAFFADSKGIVKNTGWFIDEFRKNILKDAETLSAKEIAQKLNDYLLHNFIEPEEERVKKYLEEEIKKEGGIDLVFNPRLRFTINYSFTKDGTKINRIFNIETISHASHRIFEKSAGTICLGLPHGRDE